MQPERICGSEFLPYSPDHVKEKEYGHNHLRGNAEEGGFRQLLFRGVDSPLPHRPCAGGQMIGHYQRDSRSHRSTGLVPVGGTIHRRHPTAPNHSLHRHKAGGGDELRLLP